MAECPYTQQSPPELSLHRQFYTPQNDYIITKPNAFSNFNIFVNKCIIIRNSIAFIIME